MQNMMSCLIDLGITETDIIENSVIASGTVRDMLEVLNHFRPIDIEENYDFVVHYLPTIF